ncbi:hypothetical protein BO94DRAFT_278211 [Aspergillus sclerotioniger CBS 115572]|uniref:Uncharacterized protein n=1 Tax=Aspergillus sclerotioniger CBS 115572 TaxID=1450535 RepID=A0A317XDD5_9EURO|nr:hypothetical protein BO94DRAFT_278211 [Aspergillus sclerotioniger CBS 115572]PWY94550.1 hypothetical protein BO94DRAFT_278211 [Aspergillus sclerotioniger CBS 115572]
MIYKANSLVFSKPFRALYFLLCLAERVPWFSHTPHAAHWHDWLHRLSSRGISSATPALSMRHGWPTLNSMHNSDYSYTTECGYVRVVAVHDRKAFRCSN